GGGRRRPVLGRPRRAGLLRSVPVACQEPRPIGHVRGLDGLAARVGRGDVGDGGHRLRLPPRGFRLMARSLAENDTTSLLPTIRVPTLLLWGAADQRSPIDVAERFRDAIPHAELRIISA